MFTVKRVLMIFAAVLVSAAVIDQSALARGRGGGGHPRARQVMRRDARMSARQNRNIGHYGGHYGQFKREDRGIARETRHDMEKNGGYLTKGEQRHINGQENAVNRQMSRDYRPGGNFNPGGPNKGGVNPGGPNKSASNSNPNRGNWDRRNWDRGRWDRDRRFAENHPRRAEVLGRDNSLARDIGRNEGKLGGNAKSLMSQDQAIRSQERTDAKADGGHITKAEKKQLNQEENTLRKDIKQDYTKN